MDSAQLLAKYSIGVGDRFAHQGKAQLRACAKAAASGVDVIPVWNTPNREHNIIGSLPACARAAADEAVKALGWTLRHDHTCPDYSSSLRQLFHVGFKVAAKMGNRHLDLFSVTETTIAKNVTEYLFAHYIKPVFIGE